MLLAGRQSTAQRDGLTLAHVRTHGQQPRHGSRSELSQGRFTLGEVVVHKRQLVVAFDDAAAQDAEAHR